MKEELIAIVRQFFPDTLFEEISISSIKSGLINQTFKVTISEDKKYILQQLNSSVFKYPERLQNNIFKVADHLKKNNYEKGILDPINAINGMSFYQSKDKDYWRMFSFIDNTDCYQVPPSLMFVSNAAKSLCEFHSILSTFDVKELQDPIPDFLNFKLRYKKFQEALLKGDKKRIIEVEVEASVINRFIHILQEYETIYDKLPQRIIHGDPKSSNFLFQKDSSKVYAIIDWDTLMKGTILYDFGDMVRSYTNRKLEDDTSGDNFDLEKFEVIKQTFESETFLLEVEKTNLNLGAKVVVLVQGIRFLTDYIMGDRYYNVSYPNQNLNRAKGQLNLFKGLLKYCDKIN